MLADEHAATSNQLLKKTTNCQQTSQRKASSVFSVAYSGAGHIHQWSLIDT